MRVWVWACLLVLMSEGQCLSALVLGEAVTKNQIGIVFDPTNNGYFVLMQLTMQLLVNQIPFFLCFRERPVAHNNVSCYFSTLPNDYYQCLTIVYASNTSSFSYYQWTMGADYSTLQTGVPYVPSGTIEGVKQLVVVQLDGSVDGVAFNFLPQNDTIYEVVSSMAVDNDTYDTSYPMKTNFINTFVSSFNIPSDNLLMQRQALCFYHGNYFNYLFLGGVVRDGTAFYMAAFINYNKQYEAFRAWVGLSLSKDKVRRDMLGIQPSTGTVSDLYSLYASAPYSDISSNINGTEDWTTEASSEKINSGEAGSFYYTQVSRRYDTGDTDGDEIITYKMKNIYCFAAHFTSNTDTKAVPSPQSKNYMHQILSCFTPDLTLASPHTLTLLPILALLLLSYI